MADEPLVLGIETSCDETGVGIVRGTRPCSPTRSHRSVDEHARFGGVVPEVASRAHLEAMVPTMERACARRPGSGSRDVDAVAVTAGPGLAGALLVGVAAAKALALALGVPLYGVNHLAAHVAVDTLEHGPLPEPTMALLVSGGHSSLLLVPDVTCDVRAARPTIDDAAGEAFDKVARLLGLPFPGGPHIDRAAARRRPGAIDLPARADRPARPGTAPLRLLVLRAQDRGRALGRGPGGGRRAGAGGRRRGVVPGGRRRRADAARRSTPAASRASTDLLIGGGVAANSRLRALAQERCEAAGITLRVPRPGLCTDNGAMVAALGAQAVCPRAAPSRLDLPADSSMPVDVVRV